MKLEEVWKKWTWSGERGTTRTPWDIHHISHNRICLSWRGEKYLFDCLRITGMTWHCVSVEGERGRRKRRRRRKRKRRRRRRCRRRRRREIKLILENQRRERWSSGSNLLPNLFRESRFFRSIRRRKRVVSRLIRNRIRLLGFRFRFRVKDIVVTIRGEHLSGSDFNFRQLAVSFRAVRDWFRRLIHFRIRLRERSILLRAVRFHISGLLSARIFYSGFLSTDVLHLDWLSSAEFSSGLVSDAKLYSGGLSWTRFHSGGLFRAVISSGFLSTDVFDCDRLSSIKFSSGLISDRKFDSSWLSLTFVFSSGLLSSTAIPSSYLFNDQSF